MSSPATPNRLTVINRIVTVLSAITAGANYNYTPSAVNKRFTHWRECVGFPTYSVHLMDSEKPEYDGDELYAETFYVSVKGIVSDTTDTVSALAKALTDIQKAINDDTKPGAGAGTLSTLAVQVRIGEWETDDGYLSLEGFGFFDQKIMVQLSANYGAL